LGVLALIFAAVGAVMVIASLETLIIGLLLAITGLILGILYLVKSPSKAIGITAVVIAALALPLAPISFTVHVVKEVSEELEEPDKTTTETKEAPTKAVVGQPVKCGDLSITVHGFTANPGDQFNKPKAENQFIVVDLEIDNTSKETANVSTLMQMKIQTPEGYGYDQAMYFPEPKYPDGDILAGQKARGNIAFETPANIGAMSFVFSPMFGDPVSIKLQ